MKEEIVISEAAVLTSRPERYGKQLVSHLSRHSAGTWDDDTARGSIRFGNGVAELSMTEGVLRFELTTTSDAVERLEDVIGRHLVRFATQDRLDVHWHRSDGTAGSRQTTSAA